MKNTNENRVKNMSDFVLARREAPDLFAFCDEFHETEKYLASIGHNMLRRVMVTANTNRVVIEDPMTGKEKEMIMMGANSYLGLNSHPRVVKAAHAALDTFGVGAGSPPNFSGYYKVHRELEANLATMKGTEDAIVYPSGYSTNVGLVSALLGHRDIIIMDRLSHASIIDGSLLSGAKIVTFRHNDMDSLERVLKQTKDKARGDRLVVVEGVYSMDGDIAPLDKIYPLVKKYDAKLMIDEAHATGVLGSTGRGTPEHFGLEGKIDLTMGTFSKSLGGIGGFVCAKASVVKYLRYYSRAYFFAASLTPAQVAAQNEAVNVLREEPSWHKQLWDNIRYFHEECRLRGYNIENSQTAITPIVMGDSLKTLEVTKFLHEEGIFVNPVPYPVVPKKKERLRLSLSALHTKKDLDTVLHKLEEANVKYQFTMAEKKAGVA